MKHLKEVIYGLLKHITAVNHEWSLGSFQLFETFSVFTGKD